MKKQIASVLFFAVVAGWLYAIFSLPSEQVKSELYLSADGKVALLHGQIGGSPKDGLALRTYLRALPKTVETVHLKITGGDLLLGLELAEIIRQRNWNTYVSSQCIGPCTIMFAAGKNRLAKPLASFSFQYLRWFKDNKLCMECSERKKMQSLLTDKYKMFGTPDQLAEQIANADVEALASEEGLEGFVLEYSTSFKEAKQFRVLLPSSRQFASF